MTSYKRTSFNAFDSVCETIEVLVKARKVRFSTRRLRARYEAYRAGALSFTEFDAAVGGWINHVRFADTWGLRRHVLQPFVLKLGDTPRKKRARRLAARQ